MEETQLIRQLKGLREVQPRQDWVVLAKNRIFSEEPEELKTGLVSFFPFFRYKLALAPIISVLVLIGLFGFIQSTVPGDTLFTVKKITEDAQVAFSSSGEKSTTYLKLANKRLEDLSKIAQANQVGRLNPTIKEFQASVSEATKNLVAMSVNVTSSDSIMLKELVAESQKLEENKERVEAVLGAAVGDTEELENAITQLEKQTAAYLISDLTQRTLSQDDQKLFDEAKQDFEAGDYSQALEKIWLLSNKPR